MSIKDLISKHKLLFTTRNNKLNAVEIETTTVCNRACAYCPNKTVGGRPKTQMGVDVYHKIIDSLGEMGFAGRVSPHFYG
jgi:MoaA/NifB/PqqE/SkfB family radical SAM enzyme